MPSILLSDNGVSSGSAGLKTTAASDGALVLQTTTAGGVATTAVTIGTDQSVTFAQAANLPNTFSFKNRIINGAMMIDQRNAGASVTPTTAGYSTVDRWRCTISQASKLSFQQSTTAPSNYKNSLAMTSLSAYSLGASDYFTLQQNIEGLNVADFGWGTASAVSVTLSFWVRSSLTGTFGGVVQNGSGTRNYPFTYTISAANTWEQKTVTITGETSGSWSTDNGVGITVGFGLGVGSTYSGAAGSWSSTYYLGATGATSVVGTNGATFYITGVQLEKGSTATSFDYRPYGTELALCQRYYIRYANSGTGFLGITGQVSGTNGSYFLFPISMRATPTPGFSNINSNDTSVNNAVSSIGVDSNTTNCVRAAFSCSSNTLTVGRAALIYTASNGYIDFSAEL